MTTAFQPVSWPEQPVPEHAWDCQLCELSRQRSRIVWGEGYPEAPLWVLLDNPGLREDKQGQPFVCGTRDTLQRAVHEAGLTPQDVYVTYAVKCRPIRAYDKIACRTACKSHWLRQLEQQAPQRVLCLGNIAVQAFWGDPEAEVKRLRGAWHEVNGFPTAVSYHPLAVRRRPNLWRVFLEDWTFAASGVNRG